MAMKKYGAFSFFSLWRGMDNSRMRSGHGERESLSRALDPYDLIAKNEAPAVGKPVL